MGTDLQKNNEIGLQQIQTSRDLLKAKPIAIQVSEHGNDLVKTLIRVSLEKCALGLGISLSQEMANVLCDDLLDTYKYDSVEDIQQCLKKGRQGKYGFGHNKRDVITMPLIREWMAQHLEEKAIERERIIKNRKEEKESEPVSDERAKEYLAKIKQKIGEAIKNESKVKPFENSESAWDEIIKEDLLLRQFFEARNKEDI